MFLKNENKFRISRASSLGLSAILLSSVSLPTAPARADASLDELKMRLERAEKENLTLKAEKLERENITMKLEKIEAENAALRNEAKVDKTPTASIQSKKTATAPINTPSPEVKTVARRELVEASVPAPREYALARRKVNRELDNIQKDDARREMTAAYKAPREETPAVVRQWQGIYAGINAGYGEGEIPYSTSSAGPAIAYFNGGIAPQVYNTNSYPTVTKNTANAQFNGPVVGGQVGYNYQFNNHMVLGVETDLDYASINDRYNYVQRYNIQQTSPQGVTSINLSGLSSINWLGTTRVRLGYDLGKFLPYITGGIAYGDVSLNAATTYTSIYGLMQGSTPSNFSGAAGLNHSSVQVGWAAGAGAEYFVADNFSLKGEYLYTSLSSLSSNGTALGSFWYQGGSNNISGASTYNASFNAFGIHQARVGLNYHTDWLASKPAMTAKY